MSDQTIRVAGADLEQLATDMRAASASIQQRLDALASDLRRIFGAGWEGRSRQAFDTAHQQWTSEIAQMQQVLTDAQAAVIVSQERYAAGDRRAAGFF
jgi:WXG100 family type VII secretion target